MSDIRIKSSLPAHPKCLRLIKRHGQAAGWNLIRLFLFARENKPDGILTGMNAEDIELSCDWNGEEGVFVKSLVDVGFLKVELGTYEIHDWAEHNPWAAGSKRRSEVARENAMRKWGSESNAQNRSARLAEARKKGKHTSAEWEAMKAVCGNACVACGESELELSKDHIIAICKGGSDGIDNIQPLCHRCNSSKGANGTDNRPENWYSLLVVEMENASRTSAERLQNACSISVTASVSDTVSLPTPALELVGSASVPAKRTAKPKPTTDHFNTFWLAYPKKNDKVKCLEAWGKYECDTHIAIIMPSLKRYLSELDEIKYAKNPLTWLNGQCWHDEGITAVVEIKPELTDDQKAENIRKEQEQDRAYKRQHEERMRELAEGMRQ